MLEDVLGEVAVDKAVVSLLKDGEKPKAPGMKYRHYAPKAPVTVFTGDPEKARGTFRRICRKRRGSSAFPNSPGSIPAILSMTSVRSLTKPSRPDASSTRCGNLTTRL